ncbi:hypothetical protein HT576_13905 [Haloterrigena sp. SYSU A121-1]|uniref:Blue (type 1) copper domain-containing protein n=1 Tax=Haloterrigena gelatinilytica TaxID=2741724 RepID=A0A8J8KGJ5_9EURY|nr:plastocyanin/azurin family copper-binding protein [Haloterrigena gelatinilytica]NUB92112.1 hypothetical protein [Haloterrigena gelatinilytica]
MSDYDPTRRTALRLIGATAAASGLATAATAQENESNESDGDAHEGTGDDADRRPIILAGRSEYWYGIAPEEIEGEENPTLDLAAGTEYELVWINVDGAEHELIIETEDGEELEESDSSEEAGEAVSMTFEASEDAAEYYCEYHPEAMRGDVELGQGFDLAPHEHEGHDHGTEGNESADENSSE